MPVVRPAERILLASASPRRSALLAAAGVDFDVDAPRINEALQAGETAGHYVERMAREKAVAGAARHPDRSVLAADTIVVVDDRVFGKPVDAADASRMLEALSGRAHLVLTAVAVARAAEVTVTVAATTVWMRRLDATEIQAYVDSGEPLDKAGAYAIQGGAAAFVDRIDGSLDTVIGLPVAVALELLRR